MKEHVHVPYHPATIRLGLLVAIRHFDPDLIIGDDCDQTDLLETLIDCVGVEHVDAAPLKHIIQSERRAAVEEYKRTNKRSARRG